MKHVKRFLMVALILAVVVNGFMLFIYAVNHGHFFIATALGGSLLGLVVCMAAAISEFLS